MWSPSHARVIVQRAENLLIKGKNGTNNAFVVIELGKESYRTSVKEKSGKSVVWNEECELKIPKVGNTACIVLTALHRNSLGLDQFLGTVRIPLVSFDELQRCSQWFKLEGKPGKERGKDKVRGNLEVEITFISKLQSQSLTSLQAKGKSSIGQITGSLLGLAENGSKIKLKKLTNSLQRAGFKKKHKIVDEELFVSDRDSTNNIYSVISGNQSNLDPGVISDDEENTSHKSSESIPAGNQTEISSPSSETSSTKPHSFLGPNPQISISFCDGDEKQHFGSASDFSEDTTNSSGKRKMSSQLGELQNGLTEKSLSASCVDFYMLASPKPQKKFSSSLYLEIDRTDSPKKLSKFAKKWKHFSSVDKKEIKRTVIGCEKGERSEASLSPRLQYKNKNKDELIRMVVDLQKRVNCVSIRVKDLEDYLDDILLKVMENVPKILEKS